MFIGLSLPLALTACPGGAELEDPDRFGLGAGTAGAGGASAGSAGTPGAGTSGAAGTAGNAGNGGSAGMLMYTPPACDYQTPLVAQCARAGCHRPTGSTPAVSDLDLMTAGVEARLIDVDATHGDIFCPNPDGGVLKVECLPPGCSPAKLVDRTTPANSWMLKKLEGTQGECGDTMPIAPGTLTADQKDCMIQWINAMAAAQ